MSLRPLAFKLACVVLAGAGSLSGCGSDVPDTVKIVVAQPLSGPSSERGKDMLNGALLAARELNAAGYKVDGKAVTLEIVGVDDKDDKNVAVQVANDVLKLKPIAVIGDLSTEATEATIPVYRDGHVLQLTSSSASNLTTLGQGNLFRLVANDSIQAKAMQGYAIDSLHAKTVAMLTEDSLFGRPMQADLSTGFAMRKATLLLDERIAPSATDFSAVIARMKASPPDVLVTVLREKQLLPLLTQMNAAQLSQVKIVASSPAKTAAVARAIGDLQQAYLTSSLVSADELPGGRAFLSKFRAAYKSEPVWAAHYAYDAVYVLADVLGKARSVDPEALRAALRSQDANAPVSGSMRFADSGELRYSAITIYQRQADGWQSLMRSDKW